MTNLEMLLAKPGKELFIREQIVAFHGLLTYYVDVRNIAMDELQKAWKLNEIATTILNGPAYLFPTC